LTKYRDLAWDVSIYVSPDGYGDATFSYTPKSDFSVCSQKLGIPFLIGEVVSLPSMEDRWRMLLQALVAVKLGSFLLKSGSTQSFTVMAIYLRSEMVAEQYLLVEEENEKVFPDSEQLWSS
jgi:hypothetical protein